MHGTVCMAQCVQCVQCVQCAGEAEAEGGGGVAHARRGEGGGNTLRVENEHHTVNGGEGHILFCAVHYSVVLKENLQKLERL
jgi:hypothetical protein